MAALACQHFGAGNRAENLIGWSSTPLAIMEISHTIKDGLIGVDDFLATGSNADQARKHGQADQVIRGHGNGQSRSRCDVNAKVARERRPRATMLSTGEDRFKERSANARVFPVAFAPPQSPGQKPGTVDVEVLTACQKDAAAGLYAEATAAFIRWMAGRLDEVRGRFLAMVQEIRPLASISGCHARTPGMVAELMASFDLFLEFAVEVGAVSSREALEHHKTMWDGLIEGAVESRDENQEEGTPAEVYLSMIRAALGTTNAYLDGESTGCVPGGGDDTNPANPGLVAFCGWRQVNKWFGNDIGQRLVWEPPPNAKRIGRIDDDFIYLEPTAAYGIAVEMARRQNVNVISMNEIHLHLHNSGAIGRYDSRFGKGSEQGRNRFTCRISLNASRDDKDKDKPKVRVYFLVLKRSALIPSGDEDESPQSIDLTLGGGA